MRYLLAICLAALSISVTAQTGNLKGKITAGGLPVPCLLYTSRCV